jgi:hypothetical protein
MSKSSRRNRAAARALQEARKPGGDLVAMMAEAFNDLDLSNFINPDDDLLDPTTGERWLPIGGTGKRGEDFIGIPSDENQLSNARKLCREFAESNPYAKCGHESRISYIVGSGHSYKAMWKKGFKPVKPDKNAKEAEENADLANVQAVIDDFCEVNQWHKRQQEIVQRKDRDGECFLRIFPNDDGIIRVRFVEPAQVSTPADKGTNAAFSFGIETDTDDVETANAYCIDGVWVPANEIQHRKANVDSNVKRGLPLFFPVRKNLRRAEKLLRNMSVVAEIQSAIAIIRRHTGGTQSGVEQFVQGGADKSVTSTAGKTTYHKRFGAGTILDSNASMEYEFPAQGIDASRYVTVLQAELRAIAARLNMPEFMLTSDASNANYSSTMVAEGPAVKTFERLQWDMIVDDRAIIMRALDASGLEPGLIDRIEIVATPPRVQTRDRQKDVGADKVLVDAGAMSVYTMAERNDLDPDVEKERVADEKGEAMKRAAELVKQTQANQPAGGGESGVANDVNIPFKRDDSLVPGSKRDDSLVPGSKRDDSLVPGSKQEGMALLGEAIHILKTEQFDGYP